MLRNWIAQAMSPSGQLAEGIEPARWVADQFTAWWRKQVDDSLGSAEYAARCLRGELNRVGDWDHLGDALHELTHVQDALDDLRSRLGLSEAVDGE